MYDQLEAFSVKRTPLSIEYNSSSGIQKMESGLIMDFKTQNDGEYAFISSNESMTKIRLDNLVSLNGSNVRDEFGESCALPNKK